MLKKFFILRFLLSFLLFAISFLLFKLIQFFIPIKLIASLMGCIIALFIMFFLSSILSTVLTFMQIYYTYDPSQEDSALTFTTFLQEFIQAIKSLFEKDNCYLKLLSNLKRADSYMKEKLYDSLEEDNLYTYLLEYRSNFLFKYFFDNITNKILICTFFYVVKTDSDLELEDYAKGTVFYYKVFPYLFTATFKADILMNFVVTIFYIIIFLILLLTFHTFISLPFFLVFHKIIFFFAVNHYVLSFLEKTCESKEDVEETADTEQECDNTTNSVDTILEGDIAEQSIPCVKAKSSLSDIAKVKSNDFTMSNKLSSFTNEGQSNLNSLLNQWKNNNNTSKEDALPQMKSAHKYFKLDEEKLQQMTNCNNDDYQDSSNVQDIQILPKDLFAISDLSMETKNLDIDFLLHIDEY